MKKYLKPDNLPYITALSGAMALLCRVWLMLAGVDRKGLFITGHPADVLSYIFLALTAVFVFLCVRPLTGGGRRKGMFPASLPGMVGCFAGALGLTLSGVLETPAQADLIWILSLVAGGIAGVCLAVVGIGRRKGLRCNYLLHCAITVFFLVHLVSRYRVWSREPQLQTYFFSLLASVFLLITSYQRACLDAGFGSRKIFVFVNQLAFFCCLASITSEDWLFYLCMALWTLTGLCDLSDQPAAAPMKLPEDVCFCIDALEKAGYQAYAVGGCVRDLLLGLTPHDYDLCTDAKPEEICQVFADHQLIHAGEKHGTIGVVRNQSVYEITTFRTEGVYSDGRHPDSVEFVTELKEDLARRDFTINAMAYHPKKGVIDLWDGQLDLEKQVLRAVGDPTTRFQEDALRILRGVRFALRFRLEPDWDTLSAMIGLAPNLDQLASERIFNELSGILPLLTVRTMQLYQPILTQVIPELVPCLGFDQHSRHHAYDVWDHTAFVVEATPPVLPLRLAALLHDVGKPVVFYQDEEGAGHFPEHARVGGEMANEILLRLKAPTALREQVVFLITHHMTPFEADRTLLRRRLSKYGEENCRLLLALQKADYCSKGVVGEAPNFDGIEQMLDALLQENACLEAKDLAINGYDLLALGYEAGPKLGKAMQQILQQVVDETLPNEADALLQAAKELLEETK